MFELKWTQPASDEYNRLKEEAHQAFLNRQQKKKTKSSKIEGLFKQLYKTVTYLAENPRHPSLQTHKYSALNHPYDPKGEVFEAYVQHRIPGAYRLFWCYGPANLQITILAITPHL